MDGDGDMDFVSLSDSLTLYLNNGAGNFSDKEVLLPSVSIGQEIKAMTAGDFNQDGVGVWI